MAKKKAKKKGGKKKSGGKLGINTSKLIGIAGGVLAKKKGLDTLGFLNDNISDPKMRALAKIAVGEFGPKQSFVKDMVKDSDMLNGAGDAIVALGIADLLTEMNIGNLGALEDGDDLAVAIEGIDDMDTVNDDDRRYRRSRRDDIDVVDDDVLGDDDEDTMDDDVLGADDDDLDAVNDDTDLGDDEDEDY